MWKTMWKTMWISMVYVDKMLITLVYTLCAQCKYIVSTYLPGGYIYQILT